jgi:hypothetical protein
VLVGACFAGTSGAWLPEADEIALQKLGQITLSTALRTGIETSMRPILTTREGTVRTQTLDGDGLHAKTLLGFEKSGTVHGCFALCVRPDSACRDAIDRAHLEGTLVEPPSPSLVMRALSSAVHHPQGTLGILLGACVFGAAFALVRRPRGNVRTDDHG